MASPLYLALLLHQCPLLELRMALDCVLLINHQRGIAKRYDTEDKNGFRQMSLECWACGESGA